MKTTIEHKYSVGDKAYIIENDSIKQATVVSLRFLMRENDNAPLEYGLKIEGEFFYRSEKEVYKSITTT